MNPQRQQAVARDIRSGGLRARLQAAEQRAEAAEAERDTATAALAALCQGERPPPWWMDEWRLALMREFHAVMFPCGRIKVLSRDAIRESGRSAEQVWRDLMKDVS